MAADEIYAFTVNIPAGTQQASPLVTPTVLPGRIVDRIDYRLAPGALGAVAFQIGMRGVPVIPRNAGGFIVPGTASGSFDMTRLPDSGDWSVTAYNTGAFPHALTITYYVRLIPRPVVVRQEPDYTALYELPAADYVGA